MNRRVAVSLVLGWMLLQVQRSGDWEVVGGEFPTESACLQVRAARVQGDAIADIGSALADQPADNPLRQQALDRAERRNDGRYRCALGVVTQ